MWPWSQDRAPAASCLYSYQLERSNVRIFICVKMWIIYNYIFIDINNISAVTMIQISIHNCICQLVIFVAAKLLFPDKWRLRAPLLLCENCCKSIFGKTASETYPHNAAFYYIIKASRTFVRFCSLRNVSIPTAIELYVLLCQIWE